MRRINIKPLSVNEVWQGKRFKTPKYKGYEKHVLMLLSPLEVRGERLSLLLRFGLSSKNADVDNPVKPFLDILQKRYGFNDRQIYRLTVEKEDVAKGEEYIEFTFSEFIWTQTENNCAFSIHICISYELNLTFEVLKELILTKTTEIMTIETTIQIINQLKAENNPSNNELIAFYEKKVKEAYINAINKAFN